MIAGLIVSDGFIENVNRITIVFTPTDPRVVSDELLSLGVETDDQNHVALRSGLGEIGVI